MEPAIEVADKHHTAGRRDRRRQEWRALRVRLFLLHRRHVEGGEPADFPVRARHLEEAARRTIAAAAALFLLDLLPVDLEAALAERDDQLPGSRVVTRGRPVVTAFGARASLNPGSKLLFHDVVAVLRPAGLFVEGLPDVLEQRFLVAEILAGFPIELPQHAVLADGEQHVLIPIVDEDTLEDDVEIERFRGRVLEMPRELAGIDVERQRRARIERVVVHRHAATDSQPWLGLRRAPVREVQRWIVGAGDPRLGSGAEEVRKLAPCVTLGLAVERNRAEAPYLLAGRRIVGADEALLLAIGLTGRKALDHFPLGNDG